MIRYLLGGLLVLVLCVVVGGLNILRLTHQQIDELNPEPAPYREIQASARVAGLPVKIEWLAVASQPVPRSLVLDAAHDPAPTSPFVLAFPAFVVTWADGRRFVIDAGPSRQEADTMGEGLALLGGAQPLTYHRSLGTTIDPASIRGMGFTHLHNDHTSGAAELCAAGASLTLYQTVEQFNLLNYLTFQGADELAGMGCAVRMLLALQQTALRDIQGFPGLYVMYVAGHTPGGQVFVVHVRGRQGVQTYLIAGDIANHGAAIDLDISKPSWYSRWLVPENLEQLAQLRRWLQAMAARPGIRVLLSHDLQRLQDSGVSELP